jgi:hypothetical protein
MPQFRRKMSNIGMNICWHSYKIKDERQRKYNHYDFALIDPLFTTEINAIYSCEMYEF